MTWQPIKSAPSDGRLALVYRPLAQITHDEPVTVKRLVGGNHRCWPSTVPEGQEPFNPTDGCCHVTHWMPLPDTPMTDRPIAKFENGILLQDIAGQYREVTQRDLWWTWFFLRHASVTDHAVRLKQIEEALEAYEEAQRNA